MGETEFFQGIQVFFQQNPSGVFPARKDAFSEQGHSGEKDPLAAFPGEEGLEMKQAGGGPDYYLAVSGERGGPLVEFHLREPVLPGKTVTGVTMVAVGTQAVEILLRGGPDKSRPVLYQRVEHLGGQFFRKRNQVV